MTLHEDRGLTELEPFYKKMSDEQQRGFWERKNSISNDGHPTYIFDDA